MAATTVLTFPDNDFKVRWREPYVSEALNRKVSGVIPRGVYRGLELTQHGAPMTVQLLGDAALEHLAVYETMAGYSLTIRRGGGPIVISLAAFAGQTVYIAVYATYATTVATTAEIRVYPVADYLGAVERPELLVLGKVVVPGAGVIPASDITLTDKTVPWSSLDAAMSQWAQQVSNSGFEEGQSVGGPAGQSVPGWAYVVPSGAPVVAVTTSAPHSGQRALDVTVTGPADRLLMAGPRFDSALVFDAPAVPVRLGQLISASFWVAGTTIPAFNNGVGGVALRVQFFDDTGAVLTTVSAETDNVSYVGTFPYARVQSIIGAPADCWMRWFLEVRADLAGGPGTYNIDEVLVHVSPEGPRAQDVSDQPGHLAARTLTNEVDLPNAGAATLQDRLNQTARVRNAGYDGSQVNVEMVIADASTGRFIAHRLRALDRLELHHATPGKDVYASVAAVDSGVPRVTLEAADASDVRLKSAFFDATKTVELTSTDADLPKVLGSVAPPSGSYFLVQQFKYLTGPDVYIRFYTSRESIGEAVFGFAITVNAVYDTGTSQWSADNTSVEASQFAFSSGSLRLLRRDPTTTPWASNEWDITNGSTTGLSQTTLSPWIEAFLGAHYIEQNPPSTRTAPFSAADDAAAYTDQYVPVLFTRNSATSGTGNGAWRMYISAGGGVPATFKGFIVTCNARWLPNTREWTHDHSGSQASLLQMSGGFLALRSHNPGSLTPWSDSNWNSPPSLGPGDIGASDDIHAADRVVAVNNVISQAGNVVADVGDLVASNGTVYGDAFRYNSAGSKRVIIPNGDGYSAPLGLITGEWAPGGTFWEVQSHPASLLFTFRVPKNYTVTEVRVLVDRGGGLNVTATWYKCVGTVWTYGSEVAPTATFVASDTTTSGSLEALIMPGAVTLDSDSEFHAITIFSAQVGDVVSGVSYVFTDQGPQNF